MDEDRLLKEVVARPEDDAPRLAYAKWLGEQGDPRGELIALSCEVARNPNKTKERRLKKLHDSLWPAWRAELRGFVSGAYYSIRRGFIERAECIDGRSYAPAAEALQRRAPMLRSFLVTYATNLVVDTAPMLHEIEVPSFVALDDFKAIATGKGARDLCKLVLVKASPNTAAMLALAELPQAIETLDLGFDGRLVDFDRVAVAERLAARTHLRELQLKQVKNLDRASRALAGIPSLEKLLLQNADMKSDGLLALTEGLKSLQVLDVSENYIESYASDLDAGKLLDLASPKLRELRLNKLGLSDAQAIAIAASPRATALTHLDLARNDIGDEGALALAQSKHLRNLASLNLNANAISSSTTELLRQSPNFTNTTLQLRSQRSHQRKPQVGSARVAHSAPTATTAPILGPTTAEEIASLAPTMSAPKRFEPSRTPAEPAEILIQAGIEPDRIAQDRFWFLQACQEGPTELMAAFLAHGAAVHAPEDREPPIIKAAEGGSLERIDLLLAHGASPDARDVSGDTALQTAANWKKDDLVRALAARGAALDNMNKLGFTPLLAAIQHKRQSMVELLLSLGANPNAGSERGTAPLLFARESPEAVKALLAAGANPNLTLPPFGDTLLALCAAQGAPEVVSALLEAGANDTPNQCGFTAWMRAHWEGHSEVATALKDVGSKMVKLPQRALHRAVEEGSVAAVRACLKKRAPIDGVDSYGRTPFMRALANGHLEIGEVLAEAGADLAVVAPDAVSALTYAAAGGHVSWVSRLLEQGLSANESQAGSNALLAAARAGALEVVQMLLDAGAAVDSRDEYGQTPLFLAASRDHAPLVELLIARRADVNHPNASGKSSPLDIAVSKGQVNAVRLLLAAGADTSSRGIVGATLLHQAAQRFGNVDPKFGEIAALLLDAGADFHAVNDFGQTALHLAVDSNNEPCVTVLRGRLEQRATDVFEALANDKPDVPDLTATEFHALISDGQFGIAASLVAAGLPAALASDRSHPAIVAAMGNELLAAALLDAGADPTPTNRGETSLMRAAKHGHERLVARLLKAGLDANAELPTMMETALTMAARAGHLNVIDQLLGAGALVNLWRAGTSPLMIAAHCGHVATVQRLLAAGANPNVVDKAGQTALEGARARGHTDIVRELGQHTNVDLRDRQGRTSLLKACRAGDVQAIRYLLSVGADPGRADEAGDTPLSYAALRAAPSALLSTSFQPVVPARCAATDAQLMALIRGSQDNSVHVTMTDARGDTPLHIAAMRGDQALVVSLLARGAAPEALNAVGETPWAAAIAYGGSKEVEQALLAARGRADVNLQADAYMRSNDFGKAMACGDLRTVDTLLDRFTVGFHRMSAGRSPLTQAARRHDYEMVQLLLAKGADPNVVFFSRFTALHAAVFGPIEIVRQLLHGGADPNAPEVSAGAILYAMEHARGPTMRLLLDSGATMPSEPNLEDFSVEALRTLYEVTIEREMVELAAKVADALRRAATSG